MNIKIGRITQVTSNDKRTNIMDASDKGSHDGDHNDDGDGDGDTDDKDDENKQNANVSKVRNDQDEQKREAARLESFRQANVLLEKCTAKISATHYTAVSPSRPSGVRRLAPERTDRHSSAGTSSMVSELLRCAYKHSKKIKR